MITTEWGHSKW